MDVFEIGTFRKCDEDFVHVVAHEGDPAGGTVKLKGRECKVSPLAVLDWVTQAY